MAKKHDIIWLDCIDSTNSEAKRHITELDNLSVLSAKTQTEGRGQRGNTWTSAKGENLTFSIILKYEKQIPARYQFAISAITSMAVIDYLGRNRIKAKVKWPNDIYVGDDKICGMLIENAITSGNLSNSIIGIGLNVNQTSFPSHIPNPTSMKICKQSEDKFDIEICLKNFMSIFTEYIEKYINEDNFNESVQKSYIPMMWRLDESHKFLENTTGKTIKGAIRGLSDIGHLIIEKEEGRLVEYAFKEISYVI